MFASSKPPLRVSWAVTLPRQDREMPPMPRVAVFDRPEDSRDVTARLYGRLAAEFGKSRVTRGTSTPEPTDDSDVVVVVIGPSWLTAADADGRRRLDEPTDVVRNQIQRALAAGVIVIPVLLGRTQMPRPDQLPPGLAQLPFQNGMQLRPDPDFHKDVGRLIKAIRYPARPASQRPRLGQLTKVFARGRKGAFAGALLALVCAIVWLVLNPGPSVAGNVGLGVLFAVWPLGWLVIWWRQRQTAPDAPGLFPAPSIAGGECSPQYTHGRSRIRNLGVLRLDRCSNLSRRQSAQERAAPTSRIMESLLWDVGLHGGDPARVIDFWEKA